MTKGKLVVAVTVLLGASLDAWFFVRTEGDGAAVTTANTPRAERETKSKDVPGEAVAAKKANMRELVRKAIERDLANLDTRAKVDAYLESLKQRAEDRGLVTALEVEPGIAAIRSLGGELGEDAAMEWQARFSNEMAALSRDLSGAPDGPEPLTLDEAIPWIDEIRGETDPARREASIRKYIERAQASGDPEAVGEMMQKLNAIAPAATATATARDIDAIASEIRSASDDVSKQDAIRRYIEAAKTLDPESSAEAMGRLNALANP